MYESAGEDTYWMLGGEMPVLGVLLHRVLVPMESTNCFTGSVRVKPDSFYFLFP